MNADELRAWLVEAVAAAAGLAPADVRADEPFASQGLDSARLAQLAGELERLLGRRVDPPVLFEHPTIEQLAAHLAGARRSDSELERSRAPTSVPLAIVGLACRMPKAPDLESFWRLLEGAVDAVGEPPADRPAADHGGFLDDVASFDARFFRISADEARRMDPQQRLLLETSLEALEDAGLVPASLRASRTGVFVGISAAEYALRQLESRPTIGPYTVTGNALSIAANRLSYAFDLRGPSVAVDTACSSSLVALHLAVRAIRAGDCDRAVVAGANVLLEPEVTLGLGRAGMLAPDGRCKPFDAQANGYVRGEGCGVAVLEPLDVALAAGRRVYAVILGSATNQDGASNGLTAPNPASQRAVIAAACADGGVAPHELGYVECHGTGTFLGDPIEAQALGATVGSGRRDRRPCLIGSVKSNVGHLEAAAGIAGLLKVALSLHRGRIPPSLHFERPNPNIPFAELGLEVAAKTARWPDPPARRLAGLSSFGIGGTNAHVVLEAPPPARATAAPDGPLALPLSATSAPALGRLLRAWGERVQNADEVAALAYTAAVRRTHHRPHRAAIAAASPEQLAERIRAAAADPAPLVAASRGTAAGAPRVAFVYSGQGAQWPGMGRRLLETDRLFASTIRRCDEALPAGLDWSIERVLRDGDGARLADTAVAQPALVALELALTQVWRALGIEPAAVVGHSVGEIPAAFAAGVLDLENAMRVAVLRGRLMAEAPPGRMLAVGLDRDEANVCSSTSDAAIAVAAINGDRSTVLAGEESALALVKDELAARSVFARWLDVAYAFHSPRLDGAAAALARELGPLPAAAPALPLYSTVLGRRAGDDELDAAYWSRGVREPVDFAAAFDALLADGFDAVLEVGPRPVLRSDVRRLARARGRPELAVLHTLDRDDERLALLEAACGLYRLGCSIRWEYLHPDGGTVVSLPLHPWERERHWLERRRGAIALGEGDHPLLGARVELAHDGGLAVWQAEVGLDAQPWLADHRVGGASIFPASGYVELALAAARASGRDGPIAISELELLRPLVLSDEPTLVQTTLAAAVLSVHSRPDPDAPWILHATARLEDAAPAPPEPPDRASLERRLLDRIPPALLYRLLAGIGLDYGPAFQTVIGAAAGDGDALGAVAGEPETALLDGAFQLVAVAAGLGTDAPAGGAPFVPVAARAVRRWRDPGASADVHVEVQPDGRDLEARLLLLDGAGRPALEVEGLRLRRALDERSEQAGSTRLYEVVWRERPLDAACPRRGRRDGGWLLVGDGDLREAMAAELEARGAPVASELTSGIAGVVFLAGPSADGASLLEAVRALSLGPAAGAKLVVVSRGATAEPVTDPFGALWWGLLKSVPIENPLLPTLCVDMDEDGPAQHLADELQADDPDAEVAYRNGRRFVRRIAPRGTPAGEMTVRADGAYVVTGGTGALGLLAAERLVARGARRLALLSRHEHPEAEPAIAALRARGAAVAVRRVDVAEKDQLRAALDDIRAEGPLRGVLHAAGTLRDGALVELDADALDVVLRPKVLGAWNLHELTADDPLDWFVLYSSAAGTLGSPGQANYAAASAFLDAFAHFRRAQGLPAVAVDWGPWAAGMGATVASGEERRLRTAASAIDPDEGLDVLERLVAEDRAQTVVLPFDLADLLQFYPGDVGQTFFEEIATGDVRMLKSIGLQSSVRPELATAYVAPRTPLEERIVGIWQRALAIEPVGVLDRFFDLGGDSVFANQIVIEINRALGVSIQPERAFESFTVARLAELADEDMVGRLEQLTDEQAEELLRAGG